MFEVSAQRVRLEGSVSRVPFERGVNLKASALRVGLNDCFGRISKTDST